MKISTIKKILKKNSKMSKKLEFKSYQPINLNFKVKAREKLLKSSLLVNKAAKSTLGPLGRNCLIDYEVGVPRLTKDGVTVIKNLKTKDTITNIGINLFKAISHNANKYCGDNTTSSTIIGTEIFNEGMKFLEAGGNPIIMKRGIEKAKEVVIEYLENIKEEIVYQDKKGFFDFERDVRDDGEAIINRRDNNIKGIVDNIYGEEKRIINSYEKKNINDKFGDLLNQIKKEKKHKVISNEVENYDDNDENIIEEEKEIFNEKNKDILKKIALVATNFNENISNLLVEYFCKLGPQGVHMLEMSGIMENEMIFLEGGSFMRGYANNIGFIKDKEKDGELLILKNPFVLILDYEINDLSFVLEVLERVKKLDRPLLILCKEMKENLISQLIFNVQKKVFDVSVVEFPGEFKDNFLMEDLSIIFNSHIFDEFTVTSGFHEFELSDLGEAKEIKINEYETNFITSEKKTKEHKKKLKFQLEKIEQELEGGKLKSY